eukprot:TRINITY_DN1175_c0_g1_i2.p2 TRINITY_DN1175_c0_g1~~TRINITY_DN1175_c0_g1_i2.p2  ORF type:complete len:142 (+),score=43.55 TRINITY_DN1175_c0_g1_i2:33-458(+)
MYCLEVYIFFFFFFKQKTAYEMLRSLVGSEMCIRDRVSTQSTGVTSAARCKPLQITTRPAAPSLRLEGSRSVSVRREAVCSKTCLLYTSDAADEEDSVDLGGRRIIKKKKKKEGRWKCGDRKENNRSIRMRLRRQYSCVTE